MGSVYTVHLKCAVLLRCESYINKAVMMLDCNQECRVGLLCLGTGGGVVDNNGF